MFWISFNVPVFFALNDPKRTHWFQAIFTRTPWILAYRRLTPSKAISSLCTALASEGRGHWFESSRVRQSNKKAQHCWAFLFDRCTGLQTRTKRSTNRAAIWAERQRRGKAPRIAKAIRSQSSLRSNAPALSETSLQTPAPGLPLFTTSTNPITPHQPPKKPCPRTVISFISL